MVHQSVISSSIKFEQELRRRNYVTPKNYLDFISNYKSQIANSKKRIGARVKRLESGLTRLNEAATAVDRMTIELKEKKVRGR
jgi:dynein heavy chain